MFNNLMKTLEIIVIGLIVVSVVVMAAFMYCNMVDRMIGY